ncbi:ATP-binding cassette domain-containing protein [Rubellimicrobium sp. CFH 75288]|uniref:ATP-binding cassette domain-containing protein n=1 Tax=Rubellimicrobium sp. CFH 75288 TaxID=2697034 RepID=UPI0014123946|nr:ATP-binding cassette domain-containing protein [Rubellimicrobium sp. CFH 75288]NAZ37709.1 ATP-binding cassette domain-containing protein [Rubellimicrobium sp. CFH 75288]
MSDPILELSGITMQFGPVTALDDVQFRLDRGETLALLGDNGAGKSTLIKIVSGYYRPTAGRIVLNGRPVTFHDPQDARRAGIETIYQDLALFDNLDVAANIFAGQERVAPGWRRLLGFADRRSMARDAEAAVAGMAVTIPDTRRAVEDFSGGQRQCVAIARAVMWGREILIMDEPTAALGVRETQRVLDLIRSLKARGMSVILIMHNIEHVMQVATRAVVMRSGRNRGEVAISGPDDAEAHAAIVRMLM